MIRKILTIILLFSSALVWGGVEEECNQFLNLGIEAAEKGDFALSFEYLTKAKTLAEQNEFFEQLFWILTNMGINLAEMLDYGDALEVLLEAYKIAIQHLSPRNEISILNNIAGLYYLDKKFDKAEEYYIRVFDYAKEIKDSTLIGGCALNLSLIYKESKQLDESERYLNIADGYFKQHSREHLKSISSRVELLILQEEYQNAETLALEVLPRLSDTISDNTPFVLANLAEIYLHTKDYRLTIHYALEALRIGSDIAPNIRVYKLLAQAHQQMGSYELALNYKDSVLISSDSLNIISNNKQFENNKIRFELLRNEQELIESKLKLRNERIVFLLVFLIVLILFWTIIVNTKKQQQKKKIIELQLEQERSTKLILEKQIKEQKTINLLEKEKLKNEKSNLRRKVDHKNRSLTANAIFMSNRNQLIEDIVQSLTDSEEVSKSQEVMGKLEQLKEQLKGSSDQYDFLSHFENVNPEFISSLRNNHPNLTANEIRFLSYIYINLSTKEIASLLNITPEYCKKKRQQIARKMGLENTRMLYSYLSRF